MTDERRFHELLDEFRRVGVDPDTFSAVLSVSPDEALAALRSLEDGAGPAAFLARLRHDAASGRPRSTPPSGLTSFRHEEGPDHRP